MKNIQHLTFNVEHPKHPRRRVFVEGWVLAIEKWTFSCFLFCLATSRLFGQSETNALPKLLPPHGLLPPTFWEQYGTSMIIGGTALAMLAGSILWWIFRPKPPAVVPPEAQAREALAQWLGRPEDGNCLSDISQILRRYVACTFELPAGELTTAEFCCELERNKTIGPELTQSVAGFLRECDARKFSPASAPAPLNAAGRALALISAAEKRCLQLCIHTSAPQ